MSRPSAGSSLQPVPGQASQDSGAGKALRNLSELMRDIAACRAEIILRSAALEDLERRLHADLRPLEEKMLEVRIETFRTLGKHLRSGWLSKRDRQTLESALWDLAAELETRFDVDLTADRLRFLGVDEYSQAEADADRDDDSPHVGPIEEERTNTYRESDFQQERPGTGGHAPPFEKPPSQEEAFAGDIRALYLMLARALHPDKENDAARRVEKTAWMQKVTVAYGNRDLAGLLDILSRNPLDAIGPYLSHAPLKTMQGFAKRLRRELAALTHQVDLLKAGLDPFLAGFLRDGRVHEPAYARHLAEVKKDLKSMKQRREAYATTPGVRELIAGLRIHDWHELM